MSDFLTDAEFDRFRKLIYDESGITFSDTNRSVLESRIRETLRTKQLASVEDYFRLVSSSKDELNAMLDSVTTGGKGVGWLWPWSDERFFAPWQVIKVAPFALSRYTTPYGHQVIISELMWVWLPGMVLMGMLWWRRR